MPVYKNEKTGTWEVSYSFKDLPTGKFKKRHKRGFKTKADAKKWERENYCECESQESKTFKELASEWLETIDVSQHTRSIYEDHIVYKFHELNNLKMCDISASDLIKYRKTLNQLEFATSNKNIALSILKRIIKFGNVMYGFPDPSNHISNFKKSSDEVLKEMEVWTPEEFEEFIDCVEGEEFIAFFTFLFWTGCRKGEATALQKCDLVGNSAYIRYSQINKKSGLQPTKTKSKRWVKLDKATKQVIDSLPPTDSSYVFTYKGKPICPTTARDRFVEAIEVSGVKKIRIHDLRHSHATWLISNGINIVAVSKRLGHSTINQTLKTYTHLVNRNEDDMINFIDSYHNRTTNPQMSYITDVSESSMIKPLFND